MRINLLSMKNICLPGCLFGDGGARFVNQRVTAPCSAIDLHAKIKQDVVSRAHGLQTILFFCVGTCGYILEDGWSDRTYAQYEQFENKNKNKGKIW